MDNSVYEPYFSITIGGQELSNEMMNLITDITLEDNAKESDLLSITIVDPNFMFIEDSMFVEAKEVYFIGGWKHDPSVKFTGHISAIDISFPEEGSPILVIHCMDGSYNLNRESVKKTWKNMKKSDIAKTIFAKYGLKAVVDDTGTVESSISQSDVSDIAFLIKLASETKVPYNCYIENGVGYFVKEKSSAVGEKEFYYRQSPFNLISFSPKITTESKKDVSTKSDVDTTTATVAESKVTEGSKENSQGKETKTTSPKKSFTLGADGNWTPN